MYRYGLLVLLIGIVIGWNHTGLAQGQPQYVVLPIAEQLQLAESTIEVGMGEEEKKKIRDAMQWKGKMQLGVAAIRRGDPQYPLSNENVKNAFDQWYKECYFARLTHSEHLAEWQEKRRQHLAHMVQIPQGAGNVHGYLLDLTRQIMLVIAKGNFHPVARYNAMLLLVSLNSTEAKTIGQTKSPPIPFTEGLGDAIQEYNDPKQIDAVRVAALVGMLRHATLDRQLADSPLGALRGQMGNVALSLVKTKEAPDGRTQEGHDWMRRRAIEILGESGHPGQNGQISTALLAVLEDDQAPISLRVSAAEAMGQLEYPPTATINAVETAKSMGKVAAHACYDEIRRVEAQQEREQTEQGATGGGTSMGGMYGGGSTGMFGTPQLGGSSAPDPLAYRIALTRRRVKHRAMSIKTALVGEEKRRKPVAFAGFDKPEAKADGSTPAEEEELNGILAVAANDTDRAYVRKVAEHVGFIVSLADDGSFKDLTSLVSEIRKKVRELEQECGIVVNVDEMEVEAKEAEGLLDDPLKDLGSGLGGIPSVEPAMPPDASKTKTPPGPDGKPPIAPPKKGAVVPPAEPPVTPPATPVTPPEKGTVVPPAKPPAAPKAGAPAVQP